MAYLTRDAILSAVDIPQEDVAVPEWGGSVLVRGLTGRQRDSFEAGMVRGQGRNQTLVLENMRAKLCALTIVDEQGDRLFSEADVKALSEKSAAALDRVFAVAMRLSGLTQRDVEELTKNSENGQSDGSTSD
jgi:hypothetical protein